MTTERPSDLTAAASSPENRTRSLRGSVSSDGARPIRRLRVLVNDDEVIVTGVQAVLAAHADDFEVVGGRPAEGETVDAATKSEADIVLLDISVRRGVRGLGAVAEVMAKSPPFRVVIFTNDADERSALDAFRFGVSGYLLKSISGASLADYLARVGNGEVVLDPTLAARIAMRAAQQTDGSRPWAGSDFGLSRRESEVLALLSNGLSNRLIAARLSVGEETVKTHLRSIYRKLGVTDRAQAISMALRRGILT